MTKGRYPFYLDPAAGRTVLRVLGESDAVRFVEAIRRGEVNTRGI